jgi:DNA (cytosine-5)-methyltransferase 1
MKHASLFSGIGGFDLAAEWMGWENVFHCEWMEFPRKVLDYYWPNANSYIDICKTDFKKYANKIDILTGGFPCQPFSMAGKRKGTDDERYLWGEMLRAIQEIKPQFVIAENVFGITNIDSGMVFEQVCLDLENEGYEVQTFIIPAAAKNAPHRRDRVWFIAQNISIDTKRIRRTKIGNDYGQFKTTQQSQRREQQFSRTDSSQSRWRDFPSQSPICSGADGLPTELDGITFSNWRAESIKGYGNAIVPQVAYEIFKVLQEIKN